MGLLYFIMSNTGHVLLINNKNKNPHIFLIQEQNKHWGIFGGKQEEQDQGSFAHTAARELYEESLGSLKGNPSLFSYLDHFSFKNYGSEEPTIHKTYVVVNSRIEKNDISVDHPDQPEGFGDIKNGKFFPLYLILDTIYKRKKKFIYENEEYHLRYIFTKTILQNKEFLNYLFQENNIDAMEGRLKLLNVHPIVKNTITTSSPL